MEPADILSAPKNSLLPFWGMKPAGIHAGHPCEFFTVVKVPCRHGFRLSGSFIVRDESKRGCPGFLRGLEF
jgi:hypothetical protein